MRLLTPRLGAAVEPAYQEQPTPWWREVGATAPRLLSPA